MPLGVGALSSELFKTIVDINGNPIGMNVSNINIPVMGGVLPLSNFCYTPPTSSVVSKPNDLVCQKQYCNLLNNSDFIIEGKITNGRSLCIINNNTFAGYRDERAIKQRLGGICANFNAPSSFTEIENAPSSFTKAPSSFTNAPS